MKNMIPEAALSQHTAVLGKNGSGKTFAAKAAIIEPLLERGRRVGIVDPTDAWWGLRSSRDGKGAGFPVLVLGGDHGDLPLPANGGAAVARLLVEQGVNLVACTKHLTVGERTRWAIDFFGTINRINRQPLHLVVDEAHNFAPQGKVPDPDTGKMLHAANALASEGRSKGIRLTMITQRPQKLHKDTLTCADTLVAMRVLHPLDRGAVKEWIDGCGDPAQGKEVLNSLASLKRGEGWVWYPEGGHLARGRFPEIKTFDSSATPMEGHAIETPKKAADLDLSEIRKALTEAVKEAEANDPKLLRVRIAELERELAKKPAAGVTNADTAALEAAEVRGRMAGRDEVLNAIHGSSAALQGARAALDALEGLLNVSLPPLDTIARAPIRKAAPAPAARMPIGIQLSDSSMPRAERQLLIVLAQRQPKPASRAQLSILSGYSLSSSSFANALGALRSKGYSTGYGDDNRITDAGVKALGAYEPLPTGDALIAWWLGRLPKAERSFLEYICGRYPQSVSKEELAGETGYSITSSSYANALGKLRSLELITRSGEICASEELFGG